MDESPETRENRLVCAYAYAVSEENASCGEIVTAPDLRCVEFCPQFCDTRRTGADSPKMKFAEPLRPPESSATL